MILLRAVTKIGFFDKDSLIFFELILKVLIDLFASNGIALPRRLILLSRLYATTGSITFSWKFPLCPAKVTVTSLPITSAQAIATASGITGFTFPGIMLLPG